MLLQSSTCPSLKCFLSRGYSLHDRTHLHLRPAANAVLTSDACCTPPPCLLCRVHMSWSERLRHDRHLSSTKFHGIFRLGFEQKLSKKMSHLRISSHSLIKIFPASKLSKAESLKAPAGKLRSRQSLRLHRRHHRQAVLTLAFTLWMVSVTTAEQMPPRTFVLQALTALIVGHAM